MSSHPKSNKKIVLIDGSSYLHRAYHALPPLMNSKGQATGAIYGVINMLNSLIKEEHPDYIAMVFDAKGKTFRHDLYPDYKAHRPPMQDELRSQIQPLYDIIRAMGVALIAIEGVEADDIIGTLACRATEKGLYTLISTGDKDFAQLVHPGIHLVNTMTGVTLDAAGVVKKFGVPPERITDYLALVGDAVDNVPGVPKVGPKTAVKWLAEYGSLENIIQKADSFTGKIGENLRASVHYLPIAHELVTIKQDVPLDVELEDLLINEADNQKLYDLFSALEFKTWLKNMNAKAQTAQPSTQYECLTTHIQFDGLMSRLLNCSVISFELITTKPSWDAAITGLAIALKPNEAYYIPLEHRGTDLTQLDSTWVMATLKAIFENAKIKKITQNMKYASLVLLNYHIQLQGELQDVLLQSYVYNATATAHNIDNLALMYLQESIINLESLIGKGAKKIDFAQVDLSSATQYMAQRADCIFKLNDQLLQKLQATPSLLKVYNTIEVPLVLILAHMERQGVKVDAQQLNQQSEDLAKQLLHIEEQAYTLAGETFNLGSPKQLQDILYTKLNIPILSKTPTGQPSTSEDVLQALSVDYELPGLVLEYRSLSKLKSSYTDKLPLLIDAHTNRIHTCYHQTVTATGRLSSTDPNLQNIPIRTAEGRKIRQAFIAEPDFVMLSADYSQVELRIMAHFSQDKSLIEAFNLKQDIHQFTASEVLGIPLESVSAEQRRWAKAINFGLIYGMSAFGLARQLGIARKEAEKYITTYFERYPGIAAYMQKTKEQAMEQGFVETLFGRRLYLPDIQSKNMAQKKAAERIAINAPLQGTAADIIKLAMIQMQHWIDKEKANDKIKMLMQVHDELVFEVAQDDIEQATQAVKEAMENTVILSTPLLVSVGVGSSWDAAH